MLTISLLILAAFLLTILIALALSWTAETQTEAHEPEYNAKYYENLFSQETLDELERDKWQD